MLIPSFRLYTDGLVLYAFWLCRKSETKRIEGYYINKNQASGHTFWNTLVKHMKHVHMLVPFYGQHSKFLKINKALLDILLIYAIINNKKT